MNVMRPSSTKPCRYVIIRSLTDPEPLMRFRTPGAALDALRQLRSYSGSPKAYVIVEVTQ